MDAVTGRPVAGTRVSVVRPGADSASATTDDDGIYRVNLPAVGDGVESFNVIVTPANRPSYTVRDVKLSSTTTHGDGQVLGAWVAEPYFAHALEIYYRGNPTETIKDYFAHFRRTGGAQLTGPGWVTGEYIKIIDLFGRFTMFDNTVFATGGDQEVVGDVDVYLLPPFGTSVIHDVHLTRHHIFADATPLEIRFAGPNLGYFARIVSRATRQGIPGLQATFRRTGGINVANSTFAASTNASGEFAFRLNPLGVGTLIGDLTVQQPSPDTAIVMRGLRLDTFDADGARFFAEWGIGRHLPWVGVVRAQGRGLAGVEVEARRVGGIPATPAVLTVRSDENGVFRLTGFVPGASGNLIVDLTFRPPAPYQTMVVRGVSLATFDVDSDARIVGQYDIDRP